MDEIALLTSLRPPAPEGLGDAERAEVLGRLLAAAAGEAAGQVPGRPRPARPAARLSRAPRRPAMTRRLGIRAAAVAALAAAVGILIAVPLTGTGSGRPAGHPAAAAGPRPATAAAVLLLAAHAAATTPSLTARPDQFVYTEQLIVGQQDGVGTASGGVRMVTVPPYLSRSWTSANGKRGLGGSQRNLRGGTWSRIGVESLCGGVQNHPGKEVCFPGYLTNLPRTVGGMLSYLLRSGGPNGPAAYKVLGGIVNTSSVSDLLVPNSSYVLMYRAAATVKGIYLVPHVSNIAGKAGIGVAACVPAEINKGSMPGFHGCPQRTELIFDDRTYELIGVDHVSAQGKLAPEGESALLSIGVVNKIGQLP